MEKEVDTVAVVVCPESDLYVMVTEVESSVMPVNSAPCLKVMLGSFAKTARIFFSEDQH